MINTTVFAQLVKTNLAPCFKDVRFVIGQDKSGYLGMGQEMTLDIDMEAVDEQYNTTIIKSLQKFFRELAAEGFEVYQVLIFVDGKRLNINLANFTIPDAEIQKQMEDSLSKDLNLKRMSIFVGGRVQQEQTANKPYPGISPWNAPPVIYPPSAPWNNPPTWGGGGTISGIAAGQAVTAGAPVGYTTVDNVKEACDETLKTFGPVKGDK